MLEFTSAIATTPAAVRTLIPLGVEIWVPPTLSYLDQTRVFSTSLRDHIATIWPQYRAIIFGIATGAVVRLIAPLLEDKATDPAILVVEATGKFVISLCGGHQGGGDKLAGAIAPLLGATAILTGAANGLDLPAIDVLGIPFGWQRGDGDWTAVSAAISRGEPVEVMQEAGATLWQQHLPQNHPFRFSDFAPTSPAARVWISPTKRQFAPENDFPRVQWHPRVLWLGIGCERGTAKTLMSEAIASTCQRYHLATEAIAGIGTIDLKVDEVGILELVAQGNYPLQSFSAQSLAKVSVPNPSSTVAAAVNTPSVAEAAALLAAGEDSSLLVPKQVFKDERGAVTVAIAVASQEYIGREGKLWLVGTGPGSLDQMTSAARSALSRVDAIVGYSLYLDLIEPLKRPGQIIEAYSIGEELKRAKRAIALASWGLDVAVVSSGDAGIYGMAGLVMEELSRQGWDGKTPAFEVLPGISALQAIAARVGTPLMHDFCAISLSDLLTPWEVIEQRLEAAAKADFITVLYNPKSRQRTRQIEIACEIYLRHRQRETPVAVARSLYRPGEQIVLTTLGKLLETEIDMLSTVIIGNRSTRTHTQWMLTPRGYLG